MENSHVLTWEIMTSPEGKVPAIYSEYLLNDLGVFVKRVRRVAKKGFLHALTGFRVGIVPVPGTDYRQGPLDRNVILWHKLTSLSISGNNELTITGNQEDKIILSIPAEMIEAENGVDRFIDPDILEETRLL